MSAPTRVTDRTTTEPAARFRDLIAAEWIKLWSLRSTSLGLTFCALAVIGITLNATIADYTNWPAYSPMIRAVFVPIYSMRDAFTDPAGLVLALGASSIGAITVVGEYSSGMIRTTFGAVPARHSVMAAKVVVVAAVFLAFGTIVSASAFGLTQAVLSGRHAGLSIGYPGALRAVAASALLAPVCALVGLGLGALIRHTATTIVAATATLLLLPRFIDSGHYHWVAALHNALPEPAWSRLTQTAVETAQFPHVRWPLSITGAWLVFAAWSLGAAVATVASGRQRDL